MEGLVYRILSGFTRILIEGQLFLIRGNTPEEKYLAEEYYNTLRVKYEEENWFSDCPLMTDDELYDWMVENEYWSYKEEEDIKVFKKNLEELQVKLFELGFKGREKQITKDLIKQTRQKLNNLNTKRHSFDFLSINGAATAEKHKYLTGLGICDGTGKALFTPDTFWTATFPLLDRLIIKHCECAITTTQYREIARNEPWRQHWSAREGHDGVFGRPTRDLTNEQLTLISWTRLYDSIWQHPECPGEDIVDDDDALDGFLILDSRKRKKQSDQDYVDSLSKDPHIKNASEVFVAVDNPEDAKRIMDLNSTSSRSIIRGRDKHIAKTGKVSEADLPDVKRQLMMEINKAAMAGGRG